ncbi:hypothetical protein [Paenibacillus sp. MY03]|nr:hypothetical protein [Paenibacillus sp. MY03]
MPWYQKAMMLIGQNQYAAKQYPFHTVQDINGFPGCSTSAGPFY